MTSAKNTAVATALTAILSLNGAGAIQAADASHILTMKPLHGVSFDVGTKRAVSYFLSENGICKLVLTLAEEPKWDDVASFTATRFEAAIPELKATRYNSMDGNALEFACHVGAESMTVKAVEQVAIGTAR